jgi:DNA-binding NarL/FixJ family response regulator
VAIRCEAPNPDRTLALLQAAYRLTAAEAAVALSLADGLPPEAIAAARGVSVGTVRVQIRTLFSKLGVHMLTCARHQAGGGGYSPKT